MNGYVKGLYIIIVGIFVFVNIEVIDFRRVTAPCLGLIKASPSYLPQDLLL